MRRCPIVTAGTLALLATAAAAQQPGIELKLETQTLELGEAVSVRLVCTNTGVPRTPETAVPDGLSLKLVNSTPSSSSYTDVINSRMSRTTTYTFAMRLTAVKVGTYTLGPITIEAGGNTYQSSPVSIVVLKSDTVSTPRGDQIMFAEIEVDPRSLYVTGSYTARLTIGIRQVEIDGRTFEKDWVRTLLRGGAQLSIFRGGDWNRDRTSLPDSAGVHHDYEFLEATVERRAEEVGQTLVGPVFLKVDYPTAVRLGSFRRFEISDTRRETARADAVTIEVKAPPEEGRPPDYTGAIGRYSMEVTAKPLRVHQGAPVTLTVSISGFPLRGVAGPKLTRHPELASRFDYAGEEPLGDVEGDAKVFRRAIFPKQVGEQAIPPISWSFFDPREERYVTLSSEPIAIVVYPAPATRATIAVPDDLERAPEVTSLTVLTGGISPNFVDVDAALANQSFVLTGPWIGTLVMSPLAWIVVTAVMRHRERLRSDAGLARRRRARRKARTRIRRALSHGDSVRQMHGLADSLTGYLSDRFGLPPGTLTPAEVHAHLVLHKVEEVTASEIMRFLEACDAVRYAPTAVSDLSTSQTAENVDRWIRQIEEGVLS